MAGKSPRLRRCALAAKLLRAQNVCALVARAIAPSRSSPCHRALRRARRTRPPFGSPRVAPPRARRRRGCGLAVLLRACLAAGFRWSPLRCCALAAPVCARVRALPASASFPLRRSVGAFSVSLGRSSARLRPPLWSVAFAPCALPARVPLARPASRLRCLSAPRGGAVRGRCCARFSLALSRPRGRIFLRACGRALRRCALPRCRAAVLVRLLGVGFARCSLRSVPRSEREALRARLPLLSLASRSLPLPSLRVAWAVAQARFGSASVRFAVCAARTLFIAQRGFVLPSRTSQTKYDIFCLIYRKEVRHVALSIS